MPSRRPAWQLPQPSWLTRRSFLTAGAAAGAGLLLYANQPARHELDVTEIAIALRRLPPAFDGFRIVQISDLHLEEYTEDFFLRHVVAQVNALRADLVLVTGDFISRGPLPQRLSLTAAARCAEILSALTCAERFGILGNHDAIVAPWIIRDHMEANGLPLLVDQWRRIERGGAYLYLVGLTDGLLNPNVSASMPPALDAPVILMIHEPDLSDMVVRDPRGRDTDLILSGHSHGGQIRLPGIGPMVLPPNGRKYPAGHYRLGPTQLYVNRGIGTVGVPFRLNCPAEITAITLRPSGPEPQPDTPAPRA